jgi:transposase
MAKPLYVNVKEDLPNLKSFLKKQPTHLKSRIQMLILLKKSKEPLSKMELAKQLGVDPDSAQRWRKSYVDGGIEKLLEFKRTSNVKPLIEEHLKIELEKKLNNPTEGFRSYKEMHDWIKDNYLPTIHYQTVHKYSKRVFGAKLKVPRKSHINKDIEAVEEFKKNSSQRSRK